MRKTIPIIIALSIILGIIFGLRSCVSHSRENSLTGAPTTQFVGSTTTKNGLTAYSGDISLQVLSSGKKFIEIVDDETYKKEKDRLLVKIFAGRLFGGRIYELSSGAKATLSIPLSDLRKPTDNKYWVRAAGFSSDTEYESRLERILYTLVGVPTDVMSGFFIDIEYLPNDRKVFHTYSLGPFQPFWILSSSANDLTDSVVDTSDAIKLARHFQAEGVSFDYHAGWVPWEKGSFDRMRRYIKSQGADLIVMFKMKDEGSVIQVVKQRNPSSFESFFQDKKQFARQVTSEGVEIEGYRYVRYYVKVVELAGGRKAVLGHAEKSNGETGISYQLLSGGYEYNVNFIYQSASVAVKDEKLRERVMHTFKIAETDER